jgi:hypothetical protein
LVIGQFPIIPVRYFWALLIRQQRTATAMKSDLECRLVSDDGISLPGEGWDDEPMDREGFDGSAVAHAQPPETVRLMRRIQYAMVPPLLFFIVDGTVSVVDSQAGWAFPLRFALTTAWVLLCIALFSVGGRRNIDFRIARTLRRTWKVHVIIIASLLNMILDIKAPNNPGSSFDSVVSFTGLVASTIQDGVIEISPIGAP